MRSWNFNFAIALLTLVCSRGFTQDRYPLEQERKEQSIIGNWEWTMAIGPMKQKISMEVIEKEGKLIAMVVTPDGDKIQSEDFDHKEGRVQFTVRKEKGGRVMTLTHEGELKGTKIAGAITVQGGPVDFKGKWDATRSTQK